MHQKTIGFIFTLLFSFNTSAQSLQGEATYLQTIDLHASIPESQAALKAMMPKTHDIKHAVSFSDHLMLSKNAPSESRDSKMFMTTQNEDKYLYNTKVGQMTQIGRILDINYYFELDFPEAAAIELVDESQEINGYPCKKALVKNGLGETVTVWYSTEIKAGLKLFPNLHMSQVPGVVVKTESKQMSFMLQHIEYKDIDTAIFKVPEGHRKISAEQFSDLQEEQMESMAGSTVIM